MGRQPGECMIGIKDEFAKVLNQILGLEQCSNPQLSSPTKEWVLGFQWVYRFGALSKHGICV